MWGVVHDQHWAIRCRKYRSPLELDDREATVCRTYFSVHACTPSLWFTLSIVVINGCLGQIVPRVVLELRQGSALSQADLREMAELLVAEAVQRG